MYTRKNYLYTKDHEWLRIEDHNEAYVGITDYAQSELGEIVFVDVPTIGEIINQFETFGSVEAVKTVADLNMPVSGEILLINPRLDEHPENVNSDPYMDGFIVKIKMANQDEVNNLMSEDEYKEYLKTL